ncbi:MAG: SprT family zinc-dependent metalloprotease [Desulforhabdus sp.]|jgi:predicted metal-dependent hydrolase|nr:SprT family zinc-dependent metalloprotease [Desulforhabdus sp.]
MSRLSHIDLPDGRQLDYEIQTSSKARSLRLKMTAKAGLTVIAPVGLSERQVVELVSGKVDWIASKLDQFKEVRHLLSDLKTVRPEAFDLPALAETWRVEYRATRAQTVGARTDQQGRIVVFGAVKDYERCQAALRRWLARRAKETIVPWLESMAAKSGFRTKHVMIKNQRTRWGSCSADGAISLNAKLLFLESKMVRYVLMHELCHTLERNHTSRFWTHLRLFEPQSDLLHGQMRDAWKQIPAWAQPVRAGREGV